VLKSVLREPTLWLQTISALLAVLVTFGFTGLSATQAALIVAALSAVIGAVNAVVVRPVAVFASLPSSTPKMVLPGNRMDIRGTVQVGSLGGNGGFYDYYVNVPVVTNDQKSIGAFMNLSLVLSETANPGATAARKISK